MRPDEFPEATVAYTVREELGRGTCVRIGETRDELCGGFRCSASRSARHLRRRCTMREPRRGKAERSRGRRYDVGRRSSDGPAACGIS
nr:unnamed protein product [Digitaria exilis]